MKIDNGKFVKTSDGDLGVVVNDKIIYQSGAWDELDGFDEHGKDKHNCIIEIYDACSFDNCSESKIIWFAPKKILDDKEKEYLSAVIKPFRKKIYRITKMHNLCDVSEQFIAIDFNDGAYMTFPTFKSNTMYKGMETEVQYTLEDLEL